MAKRKAIVFKDRKPEWRKLPWRWIHECNGLMDPGGYLRKESIGYKTHASAYLAAWMHVTTCRGWRLYFDN